MNQVAASAILTDALIIGAGPVGLFQAFELGLLDIQSHIVDAMPAPGGQCVALYANKPIYDIPGIPFCTGQSLVDGLLLQLKPLAPVFHLGQVVVSLGSSDSAEDGFRFQVETSTGTQFSARCVFIAAGVGAFQSRRLPVAGLEAFENQQIFYPGNQADQAATELEQELLPLVKSLVVVGGDESAVSRAIALATHCAKGSSPSVVLIHRRDTFEASPETLAQLLELRQAGKIRVLAGQITGFETIPATADAKAPALSALVVTSAESACLESVAADRVCVHLGLSPRLGPLSDWGLALERKQLPVATDTFATSIPGIYAVGDINTYPGKKKLILCGFHEATLAAFAAASRLNPEEKIQLQYTTTSKHLHQLLGVLGA